MPVNKTRKVSKYGSRRKVFGGSAEMTTGGLRKEDLVKNERGRIVSVKRHTTMKAKHGGATEPVLPKPDLNEQNVQQKNDGVYSGGKDSADRRRPNSNRSPQMHSSGDESPL
jgi:hypothetical protein